MKVLNPNNLPVSPIADLLPTQGELKDLTEKNYNKLKNNIKRRGFIDPVSVWEDDKGLKHLLNGHQRQRVLMQEEWNEPIPYFNIPAKNIQEAAAIVLELTSQYGTITQEGLDSHVAKYQLNEAEVYESTSFDGLGSYGSDEEAEVEEDEAPEVDGGGDAVSVLGTVYQLGRHRVMCGDSVDDDDVNKLMNGSLADAVFTDPPWNVNYGAVKAGNAQGYKANRTIENDNMGEDFTPWMNEVFGTMSNYSKDGCMTYVVMSAQEWGGLMTTLADNGYHWSSTIIWNKDHLVLSRKDYHTKYEPIWYGWKEGESRLHPLKDRKQSDVWDIDRPTRSDEHPTMKPIELCAKAIQNSSNPEDKIMDLFLGSGSTLIACEQTDRTCYGMELDPKYVDVIRKRYAKFTSPDDTLPENWEELTPAINSEDKAS
jgi:DNA modification methylase